MAFGSARGPQACGIMDSVPRPSSHLYPSRSCPNPRWATRP